MQMIRATLRIKFPRGKVAEARSALSSIAERTQVCLGCVESHLYQSTQDLNVLLLTQLWQTYPAIERHLRSGLFQQVILLMEMATECPEVRFEEISSSSGMEAIEQLRSGPESRI